MKLLCWQKQKVWKPIQREAKERGESPKGPINTNNCQMPHMWKALFLFPFNVDLWVFLFFLPSLFTVFIIEALYKTGYRGRHLDKIWNKIKWEEETETGEMRWMERTSESRERVMTGQVSPWGLCQWIIFTLASTHLNNMDHSADTMLLQEY